MDETVVVMPPLFLRPRDVAKAFGVSESCVSKWARAGYLHPVKLPGIRSTRYRYEEVQAFAKSDLVIDKEPR